MPIGGIDGLPLGGVEYHIAGHLGAFTPKHGEEQNPPGHDHVEGERRLQTLERLQLQLLDAAAALEDSEVNP